MTPQLINAVGYLGMAIALSSYLARNDRALSFVVTTALLVLAAHYFLLGATAVAGLNVVSALRWASASWVVRLGAAARRAWTLGALAVLASIMAFLWDGPASAFAFAGNVIVVTGSYHLQGRALRLALLASELMWAATAIAAGSTPGLLLALAGMALNVCLMRSGHARRHPAGEPVANSMEFSR